MYRRSKPKRQRSPSPAPPASNRQRTLKLPSEDEYDPADFENRSQASESDEYDPHAVENLSPESDARFSVYVDSDGFYVAASSTPHDSSSDEPSVLLPTLEHATRSLSANSSSHPPSTVVSDIGSGRNSASRPPSTVASDVGSLADDEASVFLTDDVTSDADFVMGDDELSQSIIIPAIEEPIKDPLEHPEPDPQPNRRRLGGKGRILLSLPNMENLGKRAKKSTTNLVAATKVLLARTRQYLNNTLPVPTQKMIVSFSFCQFCRTTSSSPQNEVVMKPEYQVPTPFAAELPAPYIADPRHLRSNPMLSEAERHLRTMYLARQNMPCFMLNQTLGELQATAREQAMEDTEYEETGSDEHSDDSEEREQRKRTKRYMKKKKQKQVKQTARAKWQQACEALAAEPVSKVITCSGRYVLPGWKQGDDDFFVYLGHSCTEVARSQPSPKKNKNKNKNPPHPNDLVSNFHHSYPLSHSLNLSQPVCGPVPAAGQGVNSKRNKNKKLSTKAKKLDPSTSTSPVASTSCHPPAPLTSTRPVPPNPSTSSHPRPSPPAAPTVPAPHRSSPREPRPLSEQFDGRTKAAYDAAILSGRRYHSDAFTVREFALRCSLQYSLASSDSPHDTLC